ncbi:type II toxin-antitoxin system RelE/ParE family toxin [Merismopedia glauca]|uniref:Addiction module antitoxin n=1 Tax=Merismopedia glauca CCAP 1448/3 TaxID=1296344 RepID=A0A2T1C372_9CYAN|nr:type II toxin-antitoxin system RelE/ParE family toxin [Merismopedia glauca]PSB02654.1 addiction module antitoxin [Merismopedia glauca CCAP 1448/3]
MDEQPLIQVEAAPTFSRNLRALAKKYRSIQNDIQPIIEQLEQGELPGDRISGIGYAVFKLRVRNSDNQKGKSGGYRLIYYLKTAVAIILLTIYAKSEQVDLAADDIQSIIAEYDRCAGEGKKDEEI